MIAYCGLDCAKCDGFIATKSGDIEKISKVAIQWSVKFHSDIKPEHVICDGCKLSGKKSFYCQNVCEIRKCATEKNVNTCADCRKYPCDKISFILQNSPEAKANLERIRQII